jgi:hypothetical protein
MADVKNTFGTETIYNKFSNFFVGDDGKDTSGGKVLSYRSVLDSNPIQNYDISCVPATGAGVNAGVVPFPSDDWEHNRKYTYDSGILDIWGYRKSWFHIDDFLGYADSKNLDGFTIGGLSTVEPHKYEIVAQIAKDSGDAAANPVIARIPLSPEIRTTVASAHPVGL